MTEPETVMCYGEKTPVSIRISTQVYARLGPQGIGHRHYTAQFPYDKDAVDIIRMSVGAHYAPESGGWQLRAGYPGRVERVLEEIDDLLRRKGINTDADPAEKPDRGAPVKMDRTIVRLEDGVLAGAVINVKKGPVMVERLGSPFIGDGKYARWGKPELVGATLRYAYHRPATEAEIQIAAEIRDRKEEPDTNPEPEF